MMAEMGNIPIISVVLPTYNRAHILGKTIESILKQTYQDFEIIIVDDGSTDDTEQVVKGFTDKRITYIKHEKNSGTCAAPRNTGIGAARGEYIAHQDDDTEWLPENLEKQMKAFGKASSKVGVVYSGMWRVVDGEKTYLPLPSVAKREGDIHNELLKGYWIGFPHVMVKKECFARVGLLDETLSAAIDWDIWIRISKYYEFRFIDEPLVITYYSSSTGYYDEKAWRKAIISLTDKHLPELKEVDRKICAERYFNSGVSLCIHIDLTQFSEGRKALWKAVRICPFNPKYILVSLISLSGPALFHSQRFRKLYRQLRRLQGGNSQ